MKKSFIIVSVLIVFSTLVFSQEKILVSVSPEIGTEVDREERDKYNWFPDVPNFISARFYQLSDETYEIQIRFFQNGQVTEQNRVITPEAFQDKYQSTLRPQETPREKFAKPRRGNSLSVQANRRQTVNLRLKDSTIKNIIITEIQGDSVSVEKSRHTAGGIQVTHNSYSIADVENISVIRNTNVAGILGIGAAPGILMGFMGYATGDDDGWLWRHTADEKGRTMFFLGEIIGLSVSGTISAMKSMDYDYVFTGLSYDQKKEKLDQFINRGLRRKTNVRFSPWVGAYFFSNYIDNTIFFPGIRLSICFNPRQRMEIMYGYSKSWSLQNKDFKLSRYRDIKEYTSFQLIKIGFRTDFTYHQNFNPFIAWGWGLLGKRYKTYYDYEQDYRYDESASDPDIILNIEFGFEHHFNRWISIETRVGLVENINYGLHYMGQLGIHLGRFY